MPAQAPRVSFLGRIAAVKPRIGLHRSYDQVWHSYAGYVLVLEDGPRVGIGPGAYRRHRFRIGDTVEGKALPVPDRRTEWAELYRASGLKLLSRGPEEEDRSADNEGGILPALEELRAHGHRRLDPATYERSCVRCPFGAVMPTEVIVDQWDPRRTEWRLETHCYGPHECPRYRAGRRRTARGRRPGMVFIDEG